MSISKNSAGTSRVLKIMVVDDEATVGLVLARTLDALGHRCFVYPTAQLAWKAFSDGQGDIDLLITDMQMPGMSGLELLQAVRVKNSRLPVIVMSGSVHQDDRDGAMEAGANCFLPKPLSGEDLEVAISAIFATPTN